MRYAKKEKKIHVSWQKNVKMVGEAFGGVKKCDMLTNRWELKMKVKKRHVKNVQESGKKSSVKWLLRKDLLLPEKWDGRGRVIKGASMKKVKSQKVKG